MTQEEMDQKEFGEWYEKDFPYLPTKSEKVSMQIAFLAGRRTLREKIKSDPSIGKLEVQEWPESPDY